MEVENKSIVAVNGIEKPGGRPTPAGKVGQLELEERRPDLIHRVTGGQERIEKPVLPSGHQAGS